MASQTKMKVFKLYPDEIEFLQSQALRLRMSQTDVLRLALRQMQISPKALAKTTNSMVAKSREEFGDDDW